MPRYFFDIHHHTDQLDGEGSNLADLHAAHAAALQLCGEMIREFDHTFWSAPTWQLRVRDTERELLFTLTFSADGDGAAC